MAPREFDRYMVAIGAGHHRKFARFTDSERCAHFLGVLSIAAAAPIRGYLLVGDHEADEVEVAQEASVKLGVARRTLRKLKDAGLLVYVDAVEAWRVADWRDHDPRPTRQPISPSLRAHVIKRDQGVCQLCGQAVTDGQLEIDHVISVYRGGTNDPDNLQVSHMLCNRRKGRG